MIRPARRARIAASTLFRAPACESVSMRAFGHAILLRPAGAPHRAASPQSACPCGSQAGHGELHRSLAIPWLPPLSQRNYLPRPSRRSACTLRLRKPWPVAPAVDRNRATPLDPPPGPCAMNAEHRVALRVNTVFKDPDSEKMQ